MTGCTPTSTASFAPVTVLVLPTPLPPGKLSVEVFEDDFPLNGEHDSGGGVDVISPVEPGLGGFNLVLWDTYGGLGDVTGQNSYDMFNQPLGNSLAGTTDPTTGLDACPITANPLTVTTGSGASQTTSTGNLGITGMIVTCPKYESDGMTLSPLAGQAIIANLMPEKFSVQAYPAADRIARGEEWIQTNTLDGQHPHDSFIRIGEPSYFQEYGPGGYHVSIGFANPAIINARKKDVCAGTYGPVGACNNTITGQVNVERLSRTPDQRLYPSGSHDALAWTQCWVSLGDPDAEDFMFTKCDADGNFTFTGVPGGNWRLTIGDQWNDQIIDGLSTPANVSGGQTLNLGQIGVQQWQSNIYTTTFIDDNKNGIKDPGEIGIPSVYNWVRYRDGHNANVLLTDPNGVANFNETFPLFNWYVVESDTTRYKHTGTHTVYDAGGPADGSSYCGTGPNGARACGSSKAYNFLSNTYEAIPLPSDLSVPGAVYCAAADCATESASFAAGTAIPSSANASTGRIDPPWAVAEGWSGLTSHANWIEFGMAPYASCPPACVTVPNSGGATTSTTQVGENGGIHGKVIYASTRPFDDASQMIQQPWEPNIPHVTINLYQEGFAPDGVTPTLTMVDTTQTSSWDDWAQGFYPNSTAGTGGGAGQKPYMSCPGQGTATGTNADLFFFSLNDQPQYLDLYNSEHNGTPLHTIPYNSEFKCYDAMHVGNQLQPAPYDGMYQFPSSLAIDPTSGKLLTMAGSTNGVASNMPGTNCTICVANPDSTDKYRFGNPMLPPGKYVVEVIMPPGYEVYKEEDKNLLIGDNYIAPATQQFAGLGAAIFIIPDQASVASMYDPAVQGYNPTNYQNSTLNLGLNEELSGVPGFPGFVDPVWPCAGEMRVVPDYLSLFPQVHETGPFAGATRPLCDRKEVTVTTQMGADNNFFLFTSTHIAGKFTGVITDDFTSEFDPFAPQFGEKFAPPNMPISTRDYLGNEISRVYSDHWGTYESMIFSSWEVNPPNITGYSPNMMVQCMNDPGPILDTNPSSPTFGQLINDPLFNPAYSNFCYEEPYMPGLTTYLDTPVVPTQAFVGAGYNNVDCALPDTTPAIKEVDGDGLGPWVSASGAGHTLKITALGDQQVQNDAYSGPSASVPPFNQKTVTRHYGFGTQCTAVGGACTAISGVTIGGIAAAINSWTDTSITVQVPAGIPACALQQQAQYQGTLPAGQSATALCGQIVITAGNGNQSVDAVTVTVGGKTPVHVAANATIQTAIDEAAPGDMIIVDPGTHMEMLLMWKPVRLQGVGAASSVINANTSPAGKLLDPWRRHVNCLFGLTLQGAPLESGAPFDPTGTYSCPETTGTTWNYFGTQGTSANYPQVDRNPSEALLGWDATLNGNLAELLQEPSLLGAYEGAGVTVMGRGVELHGADGFQQSLEGEYPAGSTLLSGVASNPGATPGATGALQIGDASPLCHTLASTGTTSTNNGIISQTNPYPSNFMCNPSMIDGLTVTNSSQGGGGIFLHAWAHNMQIANNRVYNNVGTLSGGINVGQGEFGPAYLAGAANAASNLPPGSCSNGSGLVANQHEPWCLQTHVNVHNNVITSNSAIGDELFTATLSGAGGVTFCTGNDYYKFNYNFVCGNLSAGEGGGVVHLGEIFNGDIEHNSIVFNQSINPTIPTNGGGIMVQGTPDTDPVCPGVPDTDCPSGLSDGTGPGLMINANLIQGNSADSGAGGGIRLQQVNGTEVATFAGQPSLWHDVTITNNIIVNNLAGWDGAGISLQDALNVNIVNNTIAHNDTLASSGVLTQSIGTPEASAPAGNCVMNGPGGPTSASCPQSAGVTSTPNSSLLTTTFGSQTVTCPTGQTGTAGHNCQEFSNPILANNILWQNRSFYIGVGSRGQANKGQDQQNIVTLYNGFSSTPAPTQTVTGACPGPSQSTYWDLGVRGDLSLAGHESGFTLSPTYSLFDPAQGYGGTNVTNANAGVVASYCNGSRVPPECTAADGCAGPSGFGVPPGIADATAPNPVFSLTPSATVDEGNNWINISWGPLALSNDAVAGGTTGNYGGGAPLGNYALAPGSVAIDKIPASTLTSLPAIARAAIKFDFFGNTRPDAGHTASVDIGAVEFQPGGSPTLSAISPTQGFRGTTVAVTLTGNNLAGATAVNVSGAGIAVNSIVSTATTVTANFVIAATAGVGSRNVTVTTPGGTTNTEPFTVVAPALTAISPTSGFRGQTVSVTITGNGGLTGSTAVAVGGTGVTVSGVTVVNDTTITAKFTIAATAGAGNHAVTVTTPGGTAGGVNFAVTAPALTGISPTSGVRGTTVTPVTITGSGGLTGSTAVSVGGTGVTVSGVTVVNDTTITATFVIATGAGLGNHAVTVITPGGLAGGVNFQVTGATLTISAPTPAMNSGGTGTKNASITVTNTATTNAASFTFSGVSTCPGGAVCIAKASGTGNGTFSITGGTCTTGAVLASGGGACTILVSYSGETNTSTANGDVTVTGTGLATASQTSATFPAN